MESSKYDSNGFICLLFGCACVARILTWLSFTFQINRDNKEIELNVCNNDGRVETDYAQSAVKMLFKANATCGSRSEWKSFFNIKTLMILVCPLLLGQFPSYTTATVLFSQSFFSFAFLRITICKQLFDQCLAFSNEYCFWIGYWIFTQPTIDSKHKNNSFRRCGPDIFLELVEYHFDYFKNTLSTCNRQIHNFNGKKILFAHTSNASTIKEEKTLESIYIVEWRVNFFPHSHLWYYYALWVDRKTNNQWNSDA